MNDYGRGQLKNMLEPFARKRREKALRKGCVQNYTLEI